MKDSTSGIWINFVISYFCNFRNNESQLRSPRLFEWLRTSSLRSMENGIRQRAHTLTPLVAEIIARKL
jgi:hypothetical protein